MSVKPRLAQPSASRDDNGEADVASTKLEEEPTLVRVLSLSISIYSDRILNRGRNSASFDDRQTFDTLLTRECQTLRVAGIPRDRSGIGRVGSPVREISINCRDSVRTEQRQTN